MASVLRELREEARLSQTDLAGLAGVDPSYISLLERNKRINPGWDKAERIVDALSERLGRPLKVSEVFGRSSVAKREVAV